MNKCMMSFRKREEKIRLELSNCESPFTWKLPTIDQLMLDQYLKAQLEKCDNIEEENEFKWTSFNLHLQLSYELYHQLGDIVNASHHADLCCQELERLSTIQCNEQLFTSIKPALWHITLATRAHLHLENRQLELAAKMIPRVPPVRAMNDVEKAGLLGVQAAVLKQYKPSGHSAALLLAREASRLDPHQAEWHFIVANCLGRTRRLKRGVITDEEIKEMQCAFSLKQDATYSSHLAQVFADYASYLYHGRFDVAICKTFREGLHISKVYARKAIDRFKEALAIRPQCPGLKVRVAHGMLKLPELAVTDATLAKKLLDEAVVHMPNNSMMYYDLGRYYSKFERDPKKAMTSLEKAHILGNYPAFLHLTGLWWQHTEEVDLITVITAALAMYKGKANRSELLVYLGVAYLLIRSDWQTAVQCFNSSLDLDHFGKYMKRFRGFFWSNYDINLMRIVTDELRLKEQRNETNKTFHTFLLKVYSINNNLFGSPPDSKLFPNFRHKQLAYKFTVRE